MKKFNLLACAIIISVTANSHANNKELNARGIMCDRIEFDELNTYSQEDLEALYCSYKVGHKIADETRAQALKLPSCRGVFKLWNSAANR